MSTLDQKSWELEKRRRMEAGARRWAAANKSDPFAFDTAMSLIKSGISDIKDGRECFCDAEPYLETRKTPTGEEYTATAYKNMKRP